MDTIDHSTLAFTELRAQAEAAMLKRSAADPNESVPLSLKAVRTLLHELSVHQIELEMQNEELRRALAQLEISRSRYFDLYEFAPVGYCTVSVKDLIVEANLTFAALLGVTRSTIATTPFTSFILREDQDKFYLLRKQALKALSAAGTRLLRLSEPASCELQLVKSDGSHCWAKLIVTSVSEENSDEYLRVILTDITARKQMETDLLNAKDAAEAANQAKSAFLGTMSHELLTPMNGILGFTEILLRSALDPKQREFVEFQRSSGHVLLTLIHDILEYTQIESGKVSMQISEYDAGVLVKDQADQFKTEASSNGLGLEINIHPNSSLLVLTDPIRFHQIMQKLLANALKFTTSGKISIELKPAQKNGQPHLRIGITDTGIGITPEQQVHLFQRFSQVDTSDTRSYGGSGLSLAICKTLVELLGGQIGCESEADRGTTFWFTLPQQSDPEASHPPGQSLFD